MSVNELIISTVDGRKEKNMDTEKSIVLVGLGPHSKRIYMRLFQKYKLIPKLIIDIQSKQEELNTYLKENGLHTRSMFIPDDEKDY